MIIPALISTWNSKILGQIGLSRQCRLHCLPVHQCLDACVQYNICRRITVVGVISVLKFWGSADVSEEACLQNYCELCRLWHNMYCVLNINLYSADVLTRLYMCRLTRAYAMCIDFS